MEPVLLAFTSVGSWALFSLIYALIYRHTSRFALGERTTFDSGLYAAMIGLPVGFGIVVASLFAMQALTAASPAIPLGAAVLAFAASATVNALIMRTEAGGKLNFLRACRVQIPPTILLIVFAILTRR